MQKTLSRYTALAGVTVTALAAASVASFGSAAAATTDLTGHAAARTASTQTRTLVGPATVLAGLSKATRSGDAAPGQVLTLAISLIPAHLDEMKALAAAQQDPTGSSYHQWLTPAGYTARFGLDAATKARTVDWLTRSGLHIGTASDAGDFYSVTGTVATIDAAFGVTEGSYHYVDSKLGPMTFVANATAPSVPADVPVAAVSGLDTVRRFSSAHVANSYDKQAAVTRTAGKGAATPAGTVATFTQGLTPQQLWSIYGEPSGDLGDGATAGLFGEGETDSVIADLRLFENLYSFPKVPVRVVRTEGGVESDYGDNAGAIEWNLDSQAITGMAPRLKSLSMYFAKTLYDPDIATDFSNWANDASGPAQMNASFGECEQGAGNVATGTASQLPYGTELGDNLEPVAEKTLMQANMEGRGLFASAGDTGSGCPEVVAPVVGAGNGIAPQPGPIVNYPCTSEFATCVGGTVISYTATAASATAAATVTRTDERSWADTGGGASHYLTEPTFQQNVTAINLPCAMSTDGTTANTGSVCRGTPDVAALSGNILGNGYELFADGAEITTGGTSLSSPLWVGMWARVSAAQTPVQSTAVAGATAAAPIGGFAAPALYPLYTNDQTGTYAKDFFDVICSEDDACTMGTDAGVGNGAYAPKKGWDYTSGLGSPNLTGIMNDLKVALTPLAPVSGSTGEAPATQSTTTTTYSPQYNAGNPALTDPTRMMTPMQTNIPQLDLLSDTRTTSADGTTLTVKLAGTTFDGTVPNGSTGVNYLAMWQYGQAEYYVEDDVTSTGSTVTTGTRSNVTGGTFAGAANATTKATAAFAGNVLTLSVPLSEVGSPPIGSLLYYPLAETVDVVGTSFTADRASASSVSQATVGQAECVGACSNAVGAPATLPEAPLAALLPLLGLAAAGGLVIRRRRSAPQA